MKFFRSHLKKNFLPGCHEPSTVHQSSPLVLYTVHKILNNVNKKGLLAIHNYVYLINKVVFYFSVMEIPVCFQNYQHLYLIHSWCDTALETLENVLHIHGFQQLFLFAKPFSSTFANTLSETEDLIILIIADIKVSWFVI